MGLEPGRCVDAVVGGFQNYGVFVNYLGVKGIIHRSTMSTPEDFDPETFPIQKGASIRCRVLCIRWDGKLVLAWEE
ncbi:unnamed protein product [marine sediment metagenome]|uniref:S1 motif domain-containing protein n=1 Tax=marine sediment metagenome TaxID=412755 RepID=X0ZHU3_9ZZZZ